MGMDGLRHGAGTPPNGVASQLKLAVGTEINFTTITGAALAAAAMTSDPGTGFIRASLPVVHQKGSNMLAFLGHSPEF
jgi:hypothetical protein